MATNAHADTESNDIKPLSVQDAVTLLTNEVGTTLYFLHVPDQRRRGRDKSKSGLHAYREVSLALRQRGAILATAHELRLVWTRFQSARTTFTTHLRDSFIDAIDWAKARDTGSTRSRKGLSTTKSIDSEISRLRWPTLPPGCFSMENEDGNQENEQISSPPLKRRKKCESTESPFRLHAQRARREVLNGAILGLQKPVHHNDDDNDDDCNEQSLLRLDADRALSGSADLNFDIILAIHIAANASEEVANWDGGDSGIRAPPFAAEERITRSGDTVIRTLVAVETLLGVEGENVITRLKQCISLNEGLSKHMGSISDARFRIIQTAALKAAGVLDSYGELIGSPADGIDDINMQTSSEKSVSLQEKARALGFH